MLRQEFTKLTGKLQFAGKSEEETKNEKMAKLSMIDPNIKSKLAKEKDEDHSSSDSEGEEDVGNLPLAMGANPKPQARTSVSAEVFGRYNKKEEFVPKVVEKPQEMRDRIKNCLIKSFMFKALGEEEMTIVIDAMEECKVQNAQTVIKQGDKGDILYVCEEGSLNCFKLFDGETEPKQVRTYEHGDAFGELALLYNAPRAATIIAKEECLLWQLDRLTFNHIVKDAAQTKRNKYEDFLGSVPVLQSLDHYERSKLADCIKEVNFAPNDQVIVEGDTENCNWFYIIISGEATATKALTAGAAPTEVEKYKAGDYFGELALLKNAPRAANVIAKTALKLASIDREAFMRLLGPLQEILKRNMEQYDHYNPAQGQ